MQPERRREYRLNKVLGAELGGQEDPLRVRIFVINISQTGLKATYQVALPESDGPQRLQLYLDSKESPLSIQARIAWQKELSVSGMFEVGFEFLEMSEEDRGRLEGFMERERTREEPKPLDLSSPWKWSNPV